MNETQKKQLREEFYEKFGDDSIRNEQIANWWLSKYDKLLQEQKEEWVKEVKKILVDEINISHTEGGMPTSRLTSAYNRIINK